MFTRAGSLVSAIVVLWMLAATVHGLPRACPVPTTTQATEAISAGQFERAVHGLDEAVDALVQVRRAVALEQTGRLDAAGKTWQGLLNSTGGDVRIRLERRINALAETELALSLAAAGKRGPAAERRRSLTIDLSSQAHGPLFPDWLQDPQALSVLLGSMPVPPLAQAQAPEVWRRVLGGPEDEEAVTVVWPKTGGPVVVGRVFVGGDVRLRAWAVDDRTGRRKSELTMGAHPNGEPVNTLGATSFQDGWVAFGTASAAPDGKNAWLLHLGGTLRPRWQATLHGQAVLAATSPKPGVLLLAGTAPDGGLRLWQVDGQGQVAWQADRPELKPDALPTGLQWSQAKRGRVKLESPTVGALEVVSAKDGLQIKVLQTPQRWRAARLPARPPALAKVAGLQAVWVRSPDGWLVLDAVATDGCARDVVWLGPNRR